MDNKDLQPNDNQQPDLHKAGVSGSLPDLEMIKVIASNAYRQGAADMDNGTATLDNFNKWFEDEVSAKVRRQ